MFLLTVTLAYTLHPRANGTSTGLAIVFPHQLASQSFRPVQNALLYRLLSGFGPFSRKLLSEMYILGKRRYLSYFFNNVQKSKNAPHEKINKRLSKRSRNFKGIFFSNVQVPYAKQNSKEICILACSLHARSYGRLMNVTSLWNVIRLSSFHGSNNKPTITVEIRRILSSLRISRKI